MCRGLQLHLLLQAKYRELESHSTAIEHERAKLESDAKSNEEEHLMTMQSLQADLQRTTNELQNLTDAKLQLEVQYMPVYAYLMCHVCCAYKCILCT